MTQAEQVKAKMKDEHRFNPYKVMEMARAMGVPSLGMGVASRSVEFPDGSFILAREMS